MSVCTPKELPLTELPDERMMFTLGMYGDGDFFDMKGVVEEFFDQIGMHKKTEYDPKAGKTFLHPGRQALISYENEVMGYLGEVHPAVADTYGIGTRAYVAVLDILNVVKHASFDRKYEGIAKFPAVNRDIRSKEKTLEEAEINGAMNKILNGLEGMGIQLRK